MTSEAPPATLRALQARGYRSLKHVDLRFDGNLCVLVGPNGSGKSTLLDVIAFLSDYVNLGLERAVQKRTRNFMDLVWGRGTRAPGFELAVEFTVGDQELRYELCVEDVGNGVRAALENGFLGHLTPEEFAESKNSRSIVQTSGREQRQIFGLEWSQDTNKGQFWFSPENMGARKLFLSYGTGNDRSAIGSLSLLPEFLDLPDNRELDFRSLKRLDTLTRHGVQCLQLDSRKLRQASRPNGDDGSRLADDGSNLPRVLERLKSDKKEWKRWLAFVRMALPELDDVRIVHREDDRHMYLMVKRAGIEVPSWGVSEGTLRLFALTVLAYLRAFPLAYLLEEPENGIHPMAIEYAYQALSAVRDAQVFITSHSPTLLRCVEIDQVLCFGHDPDMGTVIVRGEEHPRLREWRGSIDDAVFWAADIL